MVNLAFCGLTRLSSLTKFELLPFWHSFSSAYKIYVIGILESLVFEEPLLLLVFCLVFCFCFGLLLLLLSLLGAFFFVSKEYHTFFHFARWDTAQITTFAFMQNTEYAFYSKMSLTIKYLYAIVIVMGQFSDCLFFQEVTP